MSKDKKKSKKSKPDAKLSKKERRALEEREAALAAELKAREKKAAKKAKKKVDAAPFADVPKPMTKAEREAIAPTVEATVAVAEAVLNGNSSAGAKESAAATLDRVENTADLDAEIKARLAAKREARAAKVDAHIESAQSRQTGKPEKPAPAVEEVATEVGRVFEAGFVELPDPRTLVPEAAFAKPSDAETKDEFNGLGQYKIKSPDGKVRGYTRVSTFIKTVEDRTMLEKYAKRFLLEGVVIDQTPDDSGEIADKLSTVRDLIHNRNVGLARLEKADRKGKLVPGTRADLEAPILKTFRDGMNELATYFEELAGIHDKADRGTLLHSLTELYDAKGIDAVGALLEAGEITASDVADIEAYGAALKAAGITPVEREVRVVDDERKIAGRLDGVYMARFPGTKRNVRVVGDVKTGSLDFGLTIPMQVDNYSGMQGYDPEFPDERRDLKTSRTKGIVIHLPAGKAECHIYPLDLGTGRIGNKLAGEVRAFRNTGKLGIDRATDLATGIAFTDELSAGTPDAE